MPWRTSSRKPASTIGPLVVGATAVGDGDGIVIGGIAVSIDALKVVATAERPVGGEGPVLHHALPVVRRVVVERLAGGIAIDAGDIGGADQPGDFRRDGRGAIAAIFLPAFLARFRPVVEDVVGGRFDVVLVIAAIRHAQFPGQHNRESLLIHLNARPEGRAVDEAVLREMPIGLLLRIESPQQCAFGVGGIARHDQGAGELVHIAFPHQVIAIVPIAVAGSPRRPQSRHERARLLVLRRFEDVGRQVVFLLARLLDSLCAANRRRCFQAVIEAIPLRDIGTQHGGEVIAQRPGQRLLRAGGGRCAAVGLPEREHHVEGDAGRRLRIDGAAIRKVKLARLRRIATTGRTVGIVHGVIGTGAAATIARPLQIGPAIIDAHKTGTRHARHKGSRGSQRAGVVARRVGRHQHGRPVIGLRGTAVVIARVMHGGVIQHVQQVIRERATQRGEGDLLDERIARRVGSR